MLDSLPRPQVILTHESDLDGLVSGLLLQRLARRLFQCDIPLQAYHYQPWKQRQLTESSAWVCDLSFESRLDRLNWVILDHHDTQVQPRHAVLIHDPAKSASLLCYEQCRIHEDASPELDRLVHLSNVADLFLEEDPDFITALDYASLVKVYGFWPLYQLIGGRLERLLDHPLLQVMRVKREVEDPMGFDWSRQNVVEVSPALGVVETTVGNPNLIVHRLLTEKTTPHPVLATLNPRPNRTVGISLRSQSGEALPIARRLQGGGHPNACGAILPRSVQSVPEAIDYLRQVLNPNLQQQQPLNDLGSLLSQVEGKTSPT